MCFLLTAHLIFMCLNFHDNGSALSYKTVGVHFIFQSVIIILSISQFNLIKGDNHINLVNKELRYLQMEMQYTYDYYMLANEKYEDISQIRHDINNQIKTIKQLMSDPRSSDEVRKLIEQLENRMSTIKSAHFCENPIVNSVLTAMVQKADSEHIETNILVKNCTELPFENYDICSLFANLCDNAVEACRRIPESSQRFIGIRSSLKGNYFVLKTQNSFCEELKYENKIPKTGKTETGHGYGLKIIKTLQKSIMVNAVLILITEFLRLLWL